MGVAACLLPKAGSTTLMELFGGMGVPHLARDGIERPVGRRVNHSYIPALELSATQRANFCKDSKFTLTVMRNPFDRLISGYLGKIATVGGGGEHDRRGLRALFGLRPDQTPTFQQFVQYVLQSNPASLNVHWRPATLICGLDRLRYSRVLPFETLGRSLPRLAAAIKRNITSLSHGYFTASKCTANAENRASCASASASVAKTPNLHALLSQPNERMQAFYSASSHLIPNLKRLYRDDLAFTGRVAHSWRYSSPNISSTLNKSARQHSTNMSNEVVPVRKPTPAGHVRQSASRGTARHYIFSAFIVFSAQRSASSSLMRVIERLNPSVTAPARPWEMLRPGQMPPTRPMPEWWQSHGTANFTHEQVMPDLRRFMDRFWSWCPLPICGFKVFGDHVRAPGQLQHLFYDQATRIIILERRNVTARVCTRPLAECIRATQHSP